MNSTFQPAELAMRRGRWTECHVIGTIHGIPSFRGTMECWNDKGRCLVRLQDDRLVVANKDSFVVDKKERKEKIPKTAKGVKALTSDLLETLIGI